MMQRTQVREVLQHIFEEELDNKFGELRDDMVLTEEFAFDSVDYVSLIMRVEENFRIRLTNVELTNVPTVGSLVDLVESKVTESSISQMPRHAA
jgi:acyl carrier protein